MDILLSNVIWLIVLVATASAFVAYSARTVRKRGPKVYFEQLGSGILLIFVFLGKFLIKAARLLAQSAKNSDKEDATYNSVRGGILNYRTGKLDDGTDPAGWYEKD